MQTCNDQCEHPLRAWRTKQGLSRLELALQVGCHAQTIVKWEARERFPRPEHLKRIADITGGTITANDFFNANFVTGMSAERARRELDAE